jgi:magnesium-transporting ATPase (P-type)
MCSFSLASLISDTDLDNGLSTKQVAINREKYGKNELPEPEIKTLMELVMDGFEDKTLQMLSVSAIVSLVLGLRENPSTGWIEGTAILIAVFIVVFVTAANDYEKVRICCLALPTT